MASNAVWLTGTLAHVEPLRHTPAGLPVVQFKLAHRSLQTEAGSERQVECEVNCIALGETANWVSQLNAGAQISASGFLNRKHRMSAQIVLHVTQTELLKEPIHGNDE